MELVCHRQRVSAVEDEQVLGTVLVILYDINGPSARAIHVKIATNCYVHLKFYHYRKDTF